MPAMPHHSLGGRKGAHTLWSNTVDRTAATEKMRMASPTNVDYHLKRLPPQFDGATTEQRYAAAESARMAYMADLSLKSVAARRGRPSRGRGRPPQASPPRSVS